MRSSMPVACRSRSVLTEGQAHDGRAAVDMLASLGQGDILLGDAAYDSDALRQELAARGAWACVSPCPIAAACRLATIPNATGSPPMVKTIGIADVAIFAARTEG